MHVGIGPRYGRRFAGARASGPRVFGSALKMWLRADLGVTLSGSNVTLWEDQASGQAYSAGTPPTISTIAGLNNRPAVLGAGAGTILVAQRSLVTSINAPYSWIIVGDHLASTTGYMWAEDALNAYIGLINSAGSFALQNKDNAGTTTTDGKTLGVTYYAGIFSSSGAANRSSINGQALTNTAATGNLFASLSHNTLMYGVGAMKLAELILVQGQQDVRAMLAPYILARYGIAL